MLLSAYVISFRIFVVEARIFFGRIGFIIASLPYSVFRMKLRKLFLRIFAVFLVN